MNVLHITRNIPVKRLRGNRIILEIIKNLKFEQKILFPAEYVPKIPFVSGRLKVFSELRGTTKAEDINVLFYNFIRIYKGMDFFICNKCLNRKEVDKYIEGVDLIHAHYIFPDGYIALDFNIKKGIPYIVTVRQGDIDRVKKIKNVNYLERYQCVLSSAKKIISVNQAIKNDLKNIFDVDSEIIPHGINSDFLNNVKIEKPQDSIIRIITCGDFIKRKNIDWVIKSFDKISNEYDCELIIIGDGDEYPNLKKISNKVIFKGWLSHDEVIKEFYCADIFILPSDNETFGMVYIEAASQGCVIMGKKGTGVDGLFDDEICQYFVSNQDELDLKLKYLLDNKDLIDSLKLKSKMNVKEKFIWNKIIPRYESIYNAALSKI
ncbi:glycosyltransferase family 4 protein [Photobacterium damselae]|uniref:glycosyltransferase family 4 protein n=1 Tax=Photobacterium damselae TaxID=38293 RepID=UPI0011D0554D|nr:glycosyltransferase family 4 protein [Photobacterium damselae]KAB1515164.1 glycosyltransferase family 4 protein [Photobacterium damselae subsp. damselae]